MSEQRGLLKAEELDFLLDQETSSDSPEPESIGTEGQQASIRGNLEEIQLADIFQTLAMSKLEGTLRVRTPIEHREVLFKDGAVRCFTPLRAGTRRLGQRLIREGLITAEELRPALLRQRERRMPLGQLLIEENLVSSEIIDAILRRQSADEIYAMFTWRHGSFEFYRGPSLDPNTRAQLEFSPSFDANGVLLEVARRSDDWERVQQALLATDEVVARTSDDLPEGFDEDTTLVFGAVDGKTSIRELADNTLLGLFECARSLLTLFEKGLVELVKIEDLLDLARSHVDAGNLKRALVAIQTAHDRPEIDQTLEMTQAMVAILQKCGETKLAATYVLEAAQRQVEAPARLQLARQARELDPHAVPVLEFLRTTIVEQSATLDAPLVEELVGALGDLADAYGENDDQDQALALVEELERFDAGNQPNLMRKAKLLHKLGKSEEAIEVLLRLSELLKSGDRVDRLAQVYEQILKIDFRRRDIAKALKGLHTNRKSSLVKHGVLAATLAAVAISGVVVHSKMVNDEQVESTAQQAHELLEAGRPDRALAMLDATTGAVALHPSIANLKLKAQAQVLQQEQAIRDALKKSRDARLSAAADYIERGELRSALALYADLLKNAKDAQNLDQIVTTRIQSLLPRLEGLARSLPFLMPQSPSLTQSEAARSQVVKELRENFKEPDDLVAAGVLAAQGDPLFDRWGGAEQRTRLVAAAKAVHELFEVARGRSREYGDAQARVDSARRLEPVLLGAREYEAKYDFERALEAYRKLATEHPTEDELKAMFRDQVERYASILRFQQVIQKACKEGDFATAQGQLRALRRAHQNIPFDTLVELPVRVESVPVGATVFRDGQEAGKTPLLLAHVPAKDMHIRVELVGFQPEEVTVKGEAIGLVRSQLAKTPQWSVSLPGIVEHVGAHDGKGKVYLSDRAGYVTALTVADGAQAWQFKSSDLSALLTTPLVTEAGIVVGSVDGPLRCLDKTLGSVRWQVPNLSIESAPLALGDQVVVATTAGHVYSLRPQDGSQRWHQTLPGPVRNAFTASGSTLIFATTNGHLVALAGSDGSELWRVKVADSGLTAPTLTTKAILVAAEEGSVFALALGDGHRLWKQGELGQLTARPIVAGNRVLVAEGKSLTALDLESGAKSGVFQGDQLWASEPSIDGNRVILGTRTAGTLVLDSERLTVAYRLRGSKATQAAPLVLGPSEVIVTFGDKSVASFRALP